MPFALVVLLLALASAQGAGSLKWTTTAPAGAGFSIDMPGTPPPDPKKPTKYSVTLEDSTFIVDVDPLDANVRQAIATGNKAVVTAYMETFRATTISGMGGTRRTNSTADFNGYPSLFFTFDGAVGSQKYEAAQRIVLANERTYLMVAIGSAGKITKGDFDRFHGSFRITR